MTQNTKLLKHPRVADPIRAAKARRGFLKSQADNERRLKAPSPKHAWKDREPVQVASTRGGTSQVAHEARAPKAPSVNRAAHFRHERTLRVRFGHFAGKQLRTEIERCRTCGGELLSVNQTEERRRAAAKSVS